MLSPKKTVTLRIKVPANVTVVTEIIKYHGELPLLSQAGSGGPQLLEMDLTSQKTSEWLRKMTILSNDCSNCCCVRG